MKFLWHRFLKYLKEWTNWFLRAMLGERRLRQISLVLSDDDLSDPKVFVYNFGLYSTCLLMFMLDATRAFIYTYKQNSDLFLKTAKQLLKNPKEIAMDLLEYSSSKCFNVSSYYRNMIVFPHKIPGDEPSPQNSQAGNSSGSSSGQDSVPTLSSYLCSSQSEASSSGVHSQEAGAGTDAGTEAATSGSIDPSSIPQVPAADESTSASARLSPTAVTSQATSADVESLASSEKIPLQTAAERPSKRKVRQPAAERLLLDSSDDSSSLAGKPKASADVPGVEGGGAADIPEIRVEEVGGDAPAAKDDSGMTTSKSSGSVSEISSKLSSSDSATTIGTDSEFQKEPTSSPEVMDIPEDREAATAEVRTEDPKHTAPSIPENVDTPSAVPDHRAARPAEFPDRVGQDVGSSRAEDMLETPTPIAIPEEPVPGPSGISTKSSVQSSKTPVCSYRGEFTMAEIEFSLPMEDEDSEDADPTAATPIVLEYHPPKEISDDDSLDTKISGSPEFISVDSPDFVEDTSMQSPPAAISDSSSSGSPQLQTLKAVGESEIPICESSEGLKTDSPTEHPTSEKDPTATKEPATADENRTLTLTETGGVKRRLSNPKEQEVKKYRDDTSESDPQSDRMPESASALAETVAAEPEQTLPADSSDEVVVTTVSSGDDQTRVCYETNAECSTINVYRVEQRSVVGGSEQPGSSNFERRTLMDIAMPNERTFILRCRSTESGRQGSTYLLTLDVNGEHLLFKTASEEGRGDDPESVTLASEGASEESVPQTHFEVRSTGTKVHFIFFCNFKTSDENVSAPAVPAFVMSFSNENDTCCIYLRESRVKPERSEDPSKARELQDSDGSSSSTVQSSVPLVQSSESSETEYPEFINYVSEKKFAQLLKMVKLYEGEAES